MGSVTRVVLGIVIALAGCESSPLPGPARVLGLPGVADWTRVEDVTDRAGFLDTMLRGENLVRRLYFPGTETCRAIVLPDAEIEYVRGGKWGVVRNEAGVCEPVGIGLLQGWRDRRPRPVERRTPRSQASFTLFYQDEEVALVRGRFPLANRIGWVGGEDTIAVIPRRPECQGPLESGVSTMEYRISGRHPFLLGPGQGRCPIIGFIRPPPGP